MLKYVLILIIICEITGMASSSIRRFIRSLMYYTQLSNVAGLLSAAALLVFGPAEWVKTFRYLACCMLVMTMLVTIFVLVPTMKDTKLLLWSRVGFFLHLVCPVLNLTSYILLEQFASPLLMWVPALVTLVYGDIMLYFNYQRKVDGPYPFLRVYHQSRMATVLWFTVLMFLLFGIAYGTAALAVYF